MRIRDIVNGLLNVCYEELAHIRNSFEEGYTMGYNPFDKKARAEADSKNLEAIQKLLGGRIVKIDERLAEARPPERDTFN